MTKTEIYLEWNRFVYNDLRTNIPPPRAGNNCLPMYWVLLDFLFYLDDKKATGRVSYGTIGYLRSWTNFMGLDRICIYTNAGTVLYIPG